MRCNARARRLPAILLILVVSCGRPTVPSSTPSPRAIGQVTEIPLSGSQYVYDVTVGDGLVWVTSQAGLYRIDPATGAAENVVVKDYLYKIVRDTVPCGSPRAAWDACSASIRGLL